MKKCVNINIGCVIYTEVEDGINAEWIFSNQDKIERGTGFGKRITQPSPHKKFAGKYEITYVDSDGKTFPALLLNITFEGNSYCLTWERDEKIIYSGIGFEGGNHLHASYTKL